MNNEEKIIALLENMDNRIETIEKGRISDSRQIDIIANQVGKLTTEMQQGFKDMDARFEVMDERFNDMDARFEQIDEKLDKKADKLDIVRMENEIFPKLEALFDGYQQNSDKLDRIEAQVAKHEEIILRRVR